MDLSVPILSFYQKVYSVIVICVRAYESEAPVMED